MAGNHKNHCSISQLRALVLMMCRLTGLAPLSFGKQGSVRVVRVSRIAYFYSVLLISALNIAAITAIYIDVTVDPSQAVALGSIPDAIMWSLYYVLAAIVVNISSFTSPARMRAMIEFMNRIEQINHDMNNNYNFAKRDKLYIASVMFVIVLHTLLISYDSYVFIFLRGNKIRSFTQTFVSCLFVSHYLLYYHQIIIILLFQLHVLALETALETINANLERLHCVIRDEGFHNAIDVVFIKRNEMPLESTVPLKSVNIAIDRLTNNYNTHFHLPRQSIHETVRAIAHSYLEVCKLMQNVNKSFGVVILMLVFISLVQLVTMGYYAFRTLYSKRQLKMQTVWCLRHLMTLLLLTEPCHWTYQELMRTRHLMNKLTCGTATVMGPFAAVLKKFYFCLCLNNSSFSPMGVCTLTRPICVTIVGSVISYLVIVIQFHTDTSNTN